MAALLASELLIVAGEVAADAAGEATIDATLMAGVFDAAESVAAETAAELSAEAAADVEATTASTADVLTDAAAGEYGGTQASEEAVQNLADGLADEGFAGDEAVGEGEEDSDLRLRDKALNETDGDDIIDDPDTPPEQKANAKNLFNASDSDADALAKIGRVARSVVGGIASLGPIGVALFAFLGLSVVGAVTTALCKSLQTLRGEDPDQCMSSTCTLIQDAQYILSKYGWIVILAAVGYAVYDVVQNESFPFCLVVASILLYLAAGTIGPLIAKMACDASSIGTSTSCMFSPSTCQ